LHNTRLLCSSKTKAQGLYRQQSTHFAYMVKKVSSTSNNHSNYWVGSDQQEKKVILQ